MRWTASTVLRDRLRAAPETLYVAVAGHWMAQAQAGASLDYLDDPGLTGDPLIDALVAASAERVALLRGDPPPDWLSGPNRGLTTTWHPGPAGMLA